MADIFAIKSGNFSDPTVWSGGVVPSNNDDVFANGYAITIDQNVTIDQLRNDAGSQVRVVGIATPIMTSNSQDGFIANASSSQPSAPPYYAFDQSVSTGWYSGSIGSGWLSMQFPTGKIIKRYAFQTVGGNTGFLPVAWTFQGSNDGTNWTSIQTVSGQSLALSTWYVYDITNTTSYTYYRINVTATSNPNYNAAFNELQMTESTSPVIGNVAGGSYTLNGGITLTLTNTTPIVTGATTTFLTYNGTVGNTSVINATNNTITPSSACNVIAHSGTGTLTINANVTGLASASANFFRVLSTGTLNLNGNVIGVPSTQLLYILDVTDISTININGNITGCGNNGSASYSVFIRNAATVNVTGNIVGSSFAASAQNAGIWITGVANITIIGTMTGGANGNSYAIYSNNSATINATGNIIGGGGAGVVLNLGGTLNATGTITANAAQAIACNSATSGTVNITGNVNASSATTALILAASSIGNITGNLTASINSPAVNTTTSTAIVTVAGNLINTNGMMAFYGARLFIASGTRSWKFTLSDNTTDKTMYSADQIIVAGTFPAASDVRSGVSYALTQTGTCVIPPRASVATGVPVDQTTGTATIPTISLNDIWNMPVSGMTTAGSVGEKVVKIATTDVTGQQMAAFKG